MKSKRLIGDEFNWKEIIEILEHLDRSVSRAMREEITLKDLRSILKSSESMVRKQIKIMESNR